MRSKKIQMELNQLRDIKQKYDVLLRKTRLDESKYLEWNSESIVDWIMGLSDDYQKYEQLLRRNMKEEEIDGTLYEV